MPAVGSRANRNVLILDGHVLSGPTRRRRSPCNLGAPLRGQLRRSRQAALAAAHVASERRGTHCVRNEGLRLSEQLPSSRFDQRADLVALPLGFGVVRPARVPRQPDRDRANVLDSP